MPVPHRHEGDGSMSGLAIGGGGTKLPLDFITESSAILAKKGAGKTNAAIVLLEEAHAAGVPVVSIDPKGDHWGIRAGADGSPAGGLPIAVFGGLHADIPLEPTAGTYVADLIRSKRLSAVLDVSEFTVGERARFLTAFADRLYRHPAKDPMLLMLEEAHEYIPQSVRGEDARMVGAFERLVKLGRHKGLGVVMVTQRSASLNKNVLTQADNLFLMRTTSPQDRAAVKAWMDTNDEAAGIIADMPALKTGECWVLQPERGGPVKFRWRMRNTYDAGATPKVGEKPRPPATLADIDLAAVQSAMTETIERAKADDPKALRAQIASLMKQLDAKPTAERVEVEVVREVVPAWVRPQIVGLLIHLGEASEALKRIADHMTTIVTRLDDHHEDMQTPVSGGLLGTVTARRPAPAPKATSPVARAQSGAEPSLRSGARRMVEALGRMHPLRLTKAQWGTVAHLKTSGGTWSTYLSDIRRLGLIDETAAGYTLTDAGFEYLGGRPSPMTIAELQDHYRSILRSGAVKMLDALIASYPRAMSREELGDAAGIAISGGTFSTYLSDLTRNGLAEKSANGITATEILMRGAA